MSWINQISETEFKAALVAALADRPNEPAAYGLSGLTAKELKAHFDKAVGIVKEKLNALIVALGNGDLPVDGNTSLSKLIEAIKDGTFANDTLKVKYGTETISLQSALGKIIDLIAENEDAIDDIIERAKSGDLAANDLMVYYEGKKPLQQALEAIRSYIDVASNGLSEQIKDLENELYGTDPENPEEGSLKKRVQVAESDVADIKNDLSAIPPIETTPDSYTLAKRDENGRLRTNPRGDETSFKDDALDDEAVAMGDVRQFLPYKFVLHMDSDSYVLSFTVENANGDTLGAVQQVDLPIEAMVVDAAVSEDGKSIILALKNGTEVAVDVSAIVGGLVNEDTFTAEMEKKVDKFTSPDGGVYVYAVDSKGETKVKLRENPEKYCVPRRDANGNIKSNTPVDDLDTANKKFVKDTAAGKVSKASARAGKNIPWYDPSNGDEGAYTPAFDAIGGTIPLRSENGEIRTGTPTQDNHAAPKKYVDDVAAGKVDIKTNSGKWVYTTEEGVQTIRKVGTTPVSWSIPWFDENKNLKSSTPVADLDVANKRFVENTVAPIENDVAVIWDALGGAIEYASIDSTTNPVIVQSNVFPAATIDKIGTGIALAGTSILYRLEDVGGDVFYTIDIETVSITGSDVTDPVTIVASLKEELHIGDEYSFCVSVVSGSYDSAEALNVSDSYTLTTLGTRVFTIAKEDTTEITFVLGIAAERVSYDHLVLKFDIDKNFHIECVPVASVKKGTETIYTVPEQIRALTYGERPDGDDVNPVYGLAMSDTVYNYLDLEKKQYVVRCYTDFFGEIAATNATIDVAEYLTDEDGEITVAAGDEILFVDADGNSAGSTVPSTITYIVKKGASQ